MCKIVAITNRKLCKNDFLKQIETLAKSGIDQIILREKDLTLEEYVKLAKQVLKICESYETECILHNFVEAAMYLNTKKIHLSLPVLLDYTGREKTEDEVTEGAMQLWDFGKIGCSIHSMEQLQSAEEIRQKLSRGAAQMYVSAGHIFSTECKKGLPPRGLHFLQQICQNTDMPVYAIGGITPKNAGQTIESGAAGVCLMSWCMNATEQDVHDLKEQIKRGNDKRKHGKIKF